MTIIEIVKQHLKAVGADGLCAPSECGCELSDLAPCGGLPSDCVPGWKGAPCEDQDADDWLMYSSKEAAEASKKDIL